MTLGARDPGSRRPPSRCAGANRSRQPWPEPVQPEDLVPPGDDGTGAPEAYSQAVVTRTTRGRPERVVRLTAESLNRLLGLAGESLVESRWLRPFADSLQRLKRHQTELSERLDDLRGG